VASFVTVSVQNAAAMAVSDAGSSVLFYARQWFTLPYAFLSVPITTTLFTEISNMYAENNREGIKRAIVGGTQQNLLFMVPFMLYLIVFAVPLVSLFQAGSFTRESVELVAGYLRYMALSLPFYALFLFMQKVFSSLRRMKAYAMCNVVISVVQVVLTMVLCLGVSDTWDGLGLPGIALAQTAFFALGSMWCFAYLRREFNGLEGRALLKSALVSFALGCAGVAVGGALMAAFNAYIVPEGQSIAITLAALAVCGILSLVVTYGLALACKVPGTAMIGRLVNKLTRR